MPLLVRKIDRAKWEGSDPAAPSSLPADAITGCLKTSSNALSTWRIQTRSELESAVLALAAGFTNLDTVDVVPLDERSIESAGLRIVVTPGRTPIDSLADRHRDIADLTLSSLGIFAGLVLQEVHAKNVIRFTRKDLKRMLKDAIASSLLAVERLSPSVASKLNNDTTQ